MLLHFALCTRWPVFYLFIEFKASCFNRGCIRFRGIREEHMYDHYGCLVRKIHFGFENVGQEVKER